MVNDRLRAQPPPTDADRWRKGIVRSVEQAGSEYAVTVDPEGGDPVEVTVTAAIYQLFTSRVPEEYDEDPVGATAWFR